MLYRFLSFTVAALLHLYGLEHELSVVKGPQVFGDIKANGADGRQEMEHHWDHLDKDKMG